MATGWLSETERDNLTLISHDLLTAAKNRVSGIETDPALLNSSAWDALMSRLVGEAAVGVGPGAQAWSSLPCNDITLLFRVLRNGCAACEDMQASVCALVPHIVTILGSLVSSLSFDLDHSTAFSVGILTLVNTTAQNRGYVNTLSSHAPLSTLLSNIGKLTHVPVQVMSSIAVLVHTLLVGQDATITSVLSPADSASGRALLCTLALQLSTISEQEGANQQAEDTDGTTDHQGPPTKGAVQLSRLIEYTTYTVRLYLERHLLPDLYLALGTVDGDCPADTLPYLASTPQYRMVMMVCHIVEDDFEADRDRRRDRRNDDDDDDDDVPPISTETLQFLFFVYLALARLLDVTRAVEEIVEACPASWPVDARVAPLVASNTLLLLSQKIAHIYSDIHDWASGRGKADNVAALTADQLHLLAQVTVDLLRGNINRMPKENTASEVVQGHTRFQAEQIKIVANIAYRNTEIQDYLREIGALPLVLNRLNVDPELRFIREWAILALRNLCEGNPGNQEFIDNLKMQGVADNKELHDLGLKAEITEQKTVRLAHIKK